VGVTGYVERKDEGELGFKGDLQVLEEREEREERNVPSK
jgi:hypothetical protein